MNDRQSITSALFDEWSVIDDLLADLDESQWSNATALPNWTVHDVVAHLIGTESFLAGIPAPAVDVDVKTLPHVNNDVAVLNESWAIGLRDLPGAAMLARFREITATRRSALTEMSQEAWDAPTPSPVGMVPYGRFMRVRIFDCWMHEHDIRDAVDRPGDEGGPRGELAIRDIEDALGYAVGKLGKAPDGSRIAIELTGPLARTLYVAVDGRAKRVPAIDGPPTSLLRLDSRLFTRLAGGRTTAAEHAAEIEIEGDAEVGQRIVDNIGFVV